MQTKTSKDYFKTYFMCAIGGAFEYYDFSAFIFLTSTISMNFFKVHNTVLNYEKSFLILAAGYVARFLGGLFFSHLGDTKGRKKSFMLTILFMTLPTIGIALLPTYNSIGFLAPILLLSFRIVQGFSMGGEGPSAITFVHEYAPKDHKTFAMGILFGGFVLGASIASFVCILLKNLVSAENFDQWGFRIVFAIGSMLGLFGFYLRKNIRETNEFQSLLYEKKVEKIPIKTLFLTHTPTIVRCIFLLSPSSICFLYYILMSKLFLEKYYHLSSLFFFKFDFIFSFVNATLIIFFSFLAQKFKSKKIYMFGLFSLTVFVFPTEYVFRSGNQNTIFIMLLINTIAMSACIGSVFDMLASAFPPAVRNSGVSISLNIVNGLLIGITPLILSQSVEFFHTTIVFPIYLFVFIFMGIIAAKNNPKLIKCPSISSKCSKKMRN